MRTEFFATLLLTLAPTNLFAAFPTSIAEDKVQEYETCVVTKTPDDCMTVLGVAASDTPALDCLRRWGPRQCLRKSGTRIVLATRPPGPASQPAASRPTDKKEEEDKIPFNVHLQEGRFMGVILGDWTIPPLWPSEPQNPIKGFMFGIEYQKINDTLMHAVQVRASLVADYQVVGANYLFGFGPARGPFHVVLTAGANFVHAYHPNEKKDYYGVMFSAGGGIDFSPLTFLPHFWRALDPTELKKITKGWRLAMIYLEWPRFGILGTVDPVICQNGQIKIGGSFIFTIKIQISTS